MNAELNGDEAEHARLLKEQEERLLWIAETMDAWEGCLRLYHGNNRAEQTGESGYGGFRTTSEVEGLLEIRETDPTGFTPSVDVAVPNRAGNHGTVCSQAGQRFWVILRRNETKF